MIVATILMFLLALAVNMAFFVEFEFAPGINWVYLPAGVRLLATLLFAELGAIGLLLVSWAVSFLIFFPDDPVRAFAGGIVAAVAPYAVYLAARRLWGLEPNLANLTPAKLLGLALAYAVASPVLHHAWFVLHGDAYSLKGLFAMFVGDLNGSLIVLYAGKTLLRLYGTSRPR
jgi:hypothetical protein